MKAQNEELRIRNPFLDPLVTELIEDPERYHRVFSERILVGETLQVFQPANVVLLGPQGSGKSMVLNLVRYPVLSKWLVEGGGPPHPLGRVNPFLGISINLVRASFHVFGRRSISRLHKGKVDEELDAQCAADYLTHYLFREFLKGLQFLLSRNGRRFRDWAQTPLQKLQYEIRPMASWDAWYGYYKNCRSLEDLLIKVEKRLTIWRAFLNANIDKIPLDVWDSKASLEDALHAMGNVLRSCAPQEKRLSLFVVIDQYEVLPELNVTHGALLQRIVNSLIKARDPVVSYKIGARTYDWGTELRIWGAESRIEEQRDYAVVNLSTVLVRGEDSAGWLFPDFASDVAFRRMREQGFDDVSQDQIQLSLGHWNAKHEAKIYFKKDSRKWIVLKGISEAAKAAIKSEAGADASPLDLRLAGAWVLQQAKKGIQEDKILVELKTLPWRKESWRKERVGIALLQIASLANQRKRYYGWESLKYLSGSNITAFLMLCGEIWDMATKLGINPLKEELTPIVQSDGVFTASRKWATRDRVEHIGGRKRYEVLSRIGPAIREALIGDLALSNPGHSGFSLKESDLSADEKGRAVSKFIEDAVSWAIFEERIHTPKSKESATRRKWYLNPLFSPYFGIPHVRVKEPLYVSSNEVYDWLFGNSKIIFKSPRTRSTSRGQLTSQQLKLSPFE